MNVFEAVKTMLAVRSYGRQPIPDEVVTRILEAGRLTASAMNRQEWAFILIREPQSLQQLGGLASTGPYLAQAALAVVVVVPDTTLGYIDGTRAAQDMMLVAWDAGIGSNWVGNVNTEPIKKLLNVPQDRMVLTIIPFGYPADKLGKGIKSRKPLAEVVHQERFNRA